MYSLLLLSEPERQRGAKCPLAGARALMTGTTAMPDQQILLPEQQAAPGPPAQPTGQQAMLRRLASIDAFRGLVLFLMVAEILLQLHAVGKALPESRFWQFLRWAQMHVDWEGASLHDLIHPSFTFLVGVALPFSLAHRLARGEGTWRLIWHAAWRS